MQKEHSSSINVLYSDGKTGLSAKNAVLQLDGQKLKLSLDKAINPATTIMFDVPIDNIKRIVFVRGTCLIRMNNGSKYAIGTSFGQNATTKELKAWLEDVAGVKAPIKIFGIKPRLLIILYMVVAIVVIAAILANK